MHSKLLNRGVTLIEIVVVIGILGIIMLAISSFQINILQNNRFSQDSLAGAEDARVILRVMIRELRSASLGSNGSFAIMSASTSTLSFYSDTDGDGLKEQIEYYISSPTSNGATLKKSLIVPSGSPLSYLDANKKISTLAYNVRNASSTPLFEYYDSNYSGTSSPLAMPVSVTNIHLVKINLIVDVNPNTAPAVRSYTSQVNLRNLKDNL